MNAAAIFRRALLLSLALAGAIAVIGGTTSFLVAGVDGLLSVLVGTAMAAVFAGVTVASLIIAVRFDIAAFFGIVMGAWVLKAILFVVVLAVLRDAAFVHEWSLFLSIVAAITGTLIIDAVVVVKGRQGYVSDVQLPGQETPAKSPSDA